MEDGPDGLSSTTFPTTLARIVSIAGHPLLLTPLTVAIASSRWLWALIVALTTSVPVLLVILRNVRRGTWSDVDVTNRRERLGLYAAGFPILAIAALVLHLSGAGARMMQSVAAGAAMLVFGLAAHRWLKTSMHVMFAAFCAVIVADVYPVAAVAGLAVVLVIAWSRLQLRRHSVAEVIVGAAAGTLAGLAAVM